MKYIGPHVSIAGGVENAPLNAKSVGASGFAMFTKNQRQWSAPPLSPESVGAFRENCRLCGYAPEAILPHDTYLINLGQPDPEKRAASVEAFAAELERCRVLGLTMLNFHPGSHLRLVSEEEDCALIAASVREALLEVPDVRAVFENTAGQGSNMGYSLEQLARMLENVDLPERVGVCIDTCHAFAAGYDLASEEGFAEFFAKFDRLLGRENLRAMHLNDSKGERGGKLDRHAPLGDGTLGWGPFERIAADPRFDGIPLVLETPDEARWPDEIARLRRAAGETA